ncbi:cation efflux protein, CzcI family [Roseateles koreensis]|uniref:Cobalt-zinc-cadmium resistance protein n=1 Tax=Roseateles koreensis TaxID=2987526 RepID=A0ABT5KV86_9BURK|nr:cation efflux protein, CzcI family [Roseateles koreensis]MDC8785707.1 cobalt-zinc-cadmium resistance protein [Roseateles koreensis]
MLLILIAVLLPLQLSWRAAATYCQHEVLASQAVEHVGHHAHVHQGDPGDQSDQGDPKKLAAAKLAIDNDCGVCHGAGTAAPAMVLVAPEFSPAMESGVAVVATGHPSASAGPPERPQWARLA